MKEFAGSLIFNTKINNSGFNSGIKDIMGTLTKLGAAIGLALGFKGAIKEAEKYQNAIRGLTSIMEGQGRSTQKATNFIQEYTKDGLIPQTEAITAYKNLALRGYDTSQIEKVMNALKDSATYGRQASYSLGEAVQSATEGLKNENSILVDNAGVTKNVAKMWEEYARSIGKTSSQLTQQEKITAEVKGILEETNFQLGDAAGYADTYSGRIARLNAKFIEFKQNMGASFMAIVSALAPALNWLMNQLLMLANVFRAVVEVFMGVSLKQDKNTSSTKKATKAMDAYGKSVKNAAKASSGLASFDKLNTLSSNKGSASNGVSTPDIKGAGLDTKDMFPDLSKINKDFEKMKNVIKEIKPLIAGLVAGIATFVVVGKVQKLFEAFSKGESIFNKTRIGVALFVAGIVTLVMSIKELVMSWDNLSAKQKAIKVGMAVLGAAAIALGYAIAAGISAATLGIGAIIAVITTAITIITSFIIKIAKEEKAIKSTKKAAEDLVKAKEKLKSAINDNISAVDKEKDTLKKLKEVQKQYGISGSEMNRMVEEGKIKYSEMNAAQKEVYKAYIEHKDAINELVKSNDNLEKAQKKERIASWEKIMALDFEKGKYEEYKNKVIDAYKSGQLSAEEAKELISKSMTDISYSSMKTFTKDIPDNIKSGLDPVKYKTTIQKVKLAHEIMWDEIKNKAISVWDRISSGFSDAISGITEGIEIISEKFTSLKERSINKFLELKNFIFGLFNNGGQIFSGVVNGISQVFKNIVNSMIGGINKVIAIPFRRINNLLNDIRSVSIVGIKPFNKMWSYNPLPVPQIPKLAKGAVIPPRAEFMAILGDQRHGKNLEAPEGLIRQIIREEMGYNKGEIVQYITNPIYLDGNKIAEHTIKKIINIQNLEGNIL